MLAELVTSPGGPDAPPTSTIRPLANFLHSASAMTALATFALGDGRSALVSGSHGGQVHCVEVQFPGGSAARVEDIRVWALPSLREFSTPNTEGSLSQCFCFQNQIKYFFGYFDPENIFLDNENNYFSG